MWESIIPLLLSTASGAAAANAAGGNPMQGALGGALGGGLGGAIPQQGGQAPGYPWLSTILSGLGGAASALGPAMIQGMSGKGPLGASMGPKRKKGPTPMQEVLWRLLAANGGDVMLPFSLFTNDPLGIEPKEPSKFQTGATIGGLGLAGALGGIANSMGQQEQTPASDAVSREVIDLIDKMDMSQAETAISNISEADWEKLPTEVKLRLMDQLSMGDEEFGFGAGPGY